MKDANPVAAQEMLSAKPPQCRIPKGTLGIGSPPSPRATRARRPGSLKITSSCVSTGCFTVTLTAARRPRRHATARCVAVRAPVRRHPSRQPSAAAVVEIWRVKPRQGKSANRGSKIRERLLCLERGWPILVFALCRRPAWKKQVINLSRNPCTSLHRIRGDIRLAQSLHSRFSCTRIAHGFPPATSHKCTDSACKH